MQVIQRGLVLCLGLFSVINVEARDRSRYVEPAYCNPKNFYATESTPSGTGVQRLHVYKVGNLNLAGLAVGDSDVAKVKALAERYSSFQTTEKSCTWYFNDGNDGAAQEFNHRYVSNPAFKGKSIANEYQSVLNNSFDIDSINMLNCAIEHKYVAMGCDGMKHRGPSVFAMLLAFSGCTPQNATKIANKVWGTNFVSTSTREAIAQKGWEMGVARPSSRATLQKIMLGL